MHMPLLHQTLQGGSWPVTHAHRHLPGLQVRAGNREAASDGQSLLCPWPGLRSSLPEGFRGSYWQDPANPQLLSYLLPCTHAAEVK